MAGFPQCGHSFKTSVVCLAAWCQPITICFHCSNCLARVASTGWRVNRGGKSNSCGNTKARAIRCTNKQVTKINHSEVIIATSLNPLLSYKRLFASVTQNNDSRMTNDTGTLNTAARATGSGGAVASHCRRSHYCYDGPSCRVKSLYYGGISRASLT